MKSLDSLKSLTHLIINQTKYLISSSQNIEKIVVLKKRVNK